METQEHAFDRLPKESTKAWEAFVYYRNLGSDRSLDKVRRQYSDKPSYMALVARWSSRYSWVKRARAFDDYIERKSRIQLESRLPLWEARREASLEANLLLAAQIRNRLQEMINHPLLRQVTRVEGEKTVHVTEPAGWTWNTIVNGAKAVAELEAGTIAEGLMEADLESFDVESATEEELREFINRRLARGKGRQ